VNTATTHPFRFAVQAYRAESGKQWRDLARRVEGLGYSALHVSDHYVGGGPAMEGTGHRPVTLASIPAMAVAAEVTTELAIGCRMFCVPYHSPVVLAKEIATLAVLADGRVEIGLGAGWLQAEFEAMGVDFLPAGERVAMLADFVALLDQYLSGRDIDVQGKHVRASGFSPLPVPDVRPPVMIGGGAPRVLRLAGAHADIVSINFNNRSGVVGSDSVVTSTAQETARKIGWVREGAGDRFAGIELETSAYFIAMPGTETTEAALSERLGLGAAELRAFPHALVGDVNEVCDQLEQRRELYGFSYFTVGDRAIDAFAPVVERLTGR
jgi:probable F420-dependent oxidoreductase